MLSIVVYRTANQDMEQLVHLFEVYQMRYMNQSIEIKQCATEESLLRTVTLGSTDVVWYDARQGTLDEAYGLRASGYSGHLVLMADSDHWALEGYRLHASGYIMCPLEESDVFWCLENLSRPSNVRPFLPIDMDGRQVYLDQISCLESRMRRVVIHLRSGQKEIIRGKLKETCERLDRRFIKCNRSYCINMDAVTSVGDGFQMEGGVIAPIKVRERRRIIACYHEHTQQREGALRIGN